MDDDIKQMIEETTQKAKEFIKEQEEFRKVIKIGKEKSLTIKQLAKVLQDGAEEYADSHNGNFGELFKPELDAVDWKGLVAEF